MITKPKASVEESSGEESRALFALTEPIDYIEMDESEMMDSIFSDDVLHLISVILGPEVRDRLLYPVVDDVRLHNKSS